MPPSHHLSFPLPLAPCHTSPFELDLHGLHAAEACAALAGRLELLHGLLADPATAAAAAPAGRRLRVIVGRGTHSCGGDASVPRTVENALRGAGLRFEPRLGALDVQLRAPAGLAGDAAAARARPPAGAQRR